MTRQRAKVVRRTGLKILESAGEETLKCFTGIILTTYLGVTAVAAAPLAAFAVAIAKRFAAELYTLPDQNTQSLVDEPLQTAVTTLNEILEARHKTPAERKERERLLESVSDSLRKAYSHTEGRNEDQWKVRILQAFVAALREGGGASLRLWLDEFRECISDCLDIAVHKKQEAEVIQRGWADPCQEGTDLAMRSVARQARAFAFSQVEQLKKEAEELTNYATGLERYVTFLMDLSAYRRDLLKG
jgi:hypothetical protein